MSSKKQCFKVYKTISCSLLKFSYNALYFNMERSACYTFDFISLKCRGKKTARLCERLTLSFIACPNFDASCSGSNETHLSSSHVRGKISMRRAACCVQLRTKQNVEAEHQDDARAHFPVRPRTLVESKRNKRATRARMQNNAPRRARPSRRNPSTSPRANR